MPVGKLDSEYPYLILEARYEKVRENAVIRSRAVLVAIGIDWEGRPPGARSGVIANREEFNELKGSFYSGLKHVASGA